MATNDPLETKKRTTDNPVFFDRFIGILTTSRIEPAEPLTKNLANDTMIEGEGLLVETNHAENEALEHTRIVPRFSYLSILKCVIIFMRQKNIKKNENYQTSGAYVD